MAKYVLAQNLTGIDAMESDPSPVNPLVAGSSPARPTSEGIFWDNA